MKGEGVSDPRDTAVGGSANDASQALLRTRFTARVCHERGQSRQHDRWSWPVRSASLARPPAADEHVQGTSG
jgi:hypothetical protein